MGAFAIPAIMAVSSLLSSLLNPTAGAETTLLNQEASNASQAGRFASSVLPSAAGGLTQAQNFWQSILSGNTNATNRTLGPAISGIEKQAGQVLPQIANLSPRGGYSSRATADLPVQTMGNVINLKNQLFGEAPQALAQISTELGNLGVGALGGSTSAAGTGLSFLSGKDERSIQTGANLGQGLGQMLYWLMNRQGGNPSLPSGGTGNDIESSGMPSSVAVGGPS